MIMSTERAYPPPATALKPPREPRVAVISGNGAGWNDERVATLTKLWLDDRCLSCAQIAKIMGGGQTRSSVIGKVHRLGLPKRGRPHTPDGAAQRQRRPRPNVMLRIVRAPSPPPRATVDPAIFEALEGSEPRPFYERRLGECKWPIGAGADMRSCCQPEDRAGYCRTHADLAFRPDPQGAESLIKSLRRHV